MNLGYESPCSSSTCNSTSASVARHAHLLSRKRRREGDKFYIVFRMIFLGCNIGVRVCVGTV